MKHPSLFQSGYIMTQSCSDPFKQQKMQQIHQVNFSLLKIQQTPDYVEGFIFSVKNHELKDSDFFLNKIHLINKFACYFKREAKSIIGKALSEGYNLKKMLGPSFYQPDFSLAPLLNNDLKNQQFLKKISPLTAREQQCLDLFKQGRSAQATAAILNLSQRTVEHYFENIKMKLGCQSKMELLEL